MNANNISIPDNMMRLPKLDHIPKMHKTPPKFRYIAASKYCTTKPLSRMITECLKLLLLHMVSTVDRYSFVPAST